MRFVLGGLAFTLNLMDNATTFLCLRQPVANFELFEANPVASWIFGEMGLAQGLFLETAVTTLALGFLVVTSLVPDRAKLALLVLLVALPAWAVVNNLLVMDEVGIGLSLM